MGLEVERCFSYCCLTKSLKGFNHMEGAILTIMQYRAGAEIITNMILGVPVYCIPKPYSNY